MIACYGAAIAISLEQLGVSSQSSVTSAPTPLVRIRYSPCDLNGWHPDELIKGRGGRTLVLVRGSHDLDLPASNNVHLLNN